MAIAVRACAAQVATTSPKVVRTANLLVKAQFIALEGTMLDHIFLPVSDIARSIDFYQRTLAPLGVTQRLDYDGRDGPPGHPDLKGFGANNRMFLWLRAGVVEGIRMRVGFVASSPGQVDEAYRAAIAAGAADNGAPGARLHYDPRYHAANVLDPDGYSLEFVYKSWQHAEA